MLLLLLAQVPRFDNHYISLYYKWESETKLQTTKPHISKDRDTDLYLKEQIQSRVGNKASLSETYPMTPLLSKWELFFPSQLFKNKREIKNQIYTW